jgi:hypothetical protein
MGTGKKTLCNAFGFMGTGKRTFVTVCGITGNGKRKSRLNQDLKDERMTRM